MIYTLSDLEAQFSPERLALGRRLFTKGLATAPNVQRGGELVTTVIRQSRNRALRVYVRAIRSGKRTVIAGECSCRKRHNCEHVAAVLLQALADRDRLPAEIPGGAGRAARPARTQKTSQQALVYLLIVETGKLLIETAVARRTRLGNYAIIRHYDPERGAGRAAPRFIAPPDIPLLDALGRLARSPVQGCPVLDGPDSSETLAAMLATGRCFNGDPEWHAPLRQGPPRPLALRWDMNQFGYQRPVVDAVPGADVVLTLSTPWFIDYGQGQCGRLTTELPVALIRELVSLAAAPPDRVEETYRSLATAHPGAPLPAPPQPVIETAPAATPVPCLRLTTREETPERGPPDYQDFAVLRFDYGGITLGRHDPDTRRVGGRVVRVRRDPESEQAAVDCLRAAGFQKVVVVTVMRG